MDESHTPEYEGAYTAGESSGYADWELALSEVLGDDVDITPTSIAAMLTGMQSLAEWWGARPQASGYDLACQDHARQLRGVLTGTMAKSNTACPTCGADGVTECVGIDGDHVGRPPYFDASATAALESMGRASSEGSDRG